MAEAGLLAGLELVVRLVLVLVRVLQEVRSQGRREWMRKIGVDHNTGPPILSLCFSKGFVSAWMSCHWVIVHEGHDAPFNFKDRRHQDFPFRVYGRGGCYEFSFWEHYDILVVSFSFVSTWRS